jgi:hypothetical protein
MAFKFTSSTTFPVTEDPDVAVESFTSVYESLGEFTANITYEELNVATNLVVQRQIELISYTPPYQGLAASQFDAQTIKLTGVAQGVFAGSMYRFIMPDNSVKVLPMDTTEQFDALISWAPPAIRVITMTHEFQIKIKYDTPELDTIETVTIQQDVYWRYQIGLQAFRDLLARGTI